MENDTCSLANKPIIPVSVMLTLNFDIFIMMYETLQPGLNGDLTIQKSSRMYYLR